MDCEDCRHMTVVGLHDTGPRHPHIALRQAPPGQRKGGRLKVHAERYTRIRKEEARPEMKSAGLLKMEMSG